MTRILVALTLSFAALTAHAVDLSTTPLGIAAAALQVGQAAKYSSASYDALPWQGDSFYYGDGAAWNPIAQRIEFVASPVGGSPRYRYTYDLVTDEFAADPTNLWQTNGHGYDSNAVTDAGVHCFAKYGAQVVCRAPDGTWSELPALPWAPGTVQALENWPGKGLVIASRQGSIALWNGATWQNIPGAAAWGNTGTWAATVGDAVYLGANTYVYRLTMSGSTPVLTEMPAPPWSMANNQAMHTTDGTKLLVARADGAAWTEFDGTAWNDRPDLVSNAIRQSHHYYVVYIPEIEAIVTMGQRTPTLHEVWVVKVGAPPPPPPPPTCIPQSAIPPEFWGLPLCSAAVEKRDPCDQPGVVVCENFTGKTVGTIYPASSGLTTPTVADGVMRMEIVSNGGRDTGHYRVSFPGVGEGGVLAWTYGKRLDAEAMRHQGQKDWIVWAPFWAPSCTSQQLVQTHMYEAMIPIAYRSCGAPSIKGTLADGDTLWQTGDFDCRYRYAKRGDVSGCHTKRADEWADYYFEVRVGHFTQPDSQLVGYVRTPGTAWRKFYDFPFTLPTRDPLETMMLTSYMTDEPVFVHPTGIVEFRRLIIANKRLDLALL